MKPTLRDNDALLASASYRKVPTPGQPGSAPFIWTADIAYAPEALVMVARNLPIHAHPASPDPAPLRANGNSKGYDELFMAKLHTLSCDRRVGCACEVHDMRKHGHWYRVTNKPTQS